MRIASGRIFDRASASIIRRVEPSSGTCSVTYCEAPQQFVEPDPAGAGAGLDLGGGRDDVVIQHLHPEGDPGDLADPPPDPAEADDTDGPALQVATGVLQSASGSRPRRRAAIVWGKYFERPIMKAKACSATLSVFAPGVVRT